MTGFWLGFVDDDKAYFTHSDFEDYIWMATLEQQ
jgi:hypothetical protein